MAWASVLQRRRYAVEQPAGRREPLLLGATVRERRGAAVLGFAATPRRLLSSAPAWSPENAPATVQAGRARLLRLRLGSSSSSRVHQRHPVEPLCVEERVIALIMLLQEKISAPERSCLQLSGSSSTVDSHLDDSLLVVPIFVKHLSGELALSVSLHQPSHRLMRLYEQKTNTKLKDQYFVYKRKRLHPDHTLMSYGLERDCTIHVCSGLLGGDATTLAQYVHDNRHVFMIEVTLPNRRVSLQMTTAGCQFLSSWLNCFTTAFSKGQSWNGQFTLEEFKFVEGHIRYIRKPKRNCPPGSLANDLMKFVGYVEDVLCCTKSYLISKYPPYLEHFTAHVRSLESILSITNVLSSEDKSFLETHVCLMTSHARETLIIELFRKYEGLNQIEASNWDTAIAFATCPASWQSSLSRASSFFKNIIQKANSKGIYYDPSKFSAFVFVKDVVLHATDDSTGHDNTPQPGDGIELMIPAHLMNFLPTVILNLIKNNVDISEELLAAIMCACSICDSRH